MLNIYPKPSDSDQHSDQHCEDFCAQSSAYAACENSAVANTPSAEEAISGNQTFFSNKVIFLNTILTVLIVFLHSNPLARFDMATDWSHPMICFLYHVTLCAVPMFFFISAILFYRSCNSYGSVKRKLHKRLRTLLIPYLLWNTIFALLFYVLGNLNLSVANFISAPETLEDWTRAILNAKYTVLWFVKILIYFTICSPIILWLLRRKTVYIIVMSASIVISYAWAMTSYMSFFLWLPVYLMGAYVGYFKISLPANRMLAGIFAILLMIAFAMSFKRGFGLYIFRMSSPILLWFLIDWWLTDFLSYRFRPKAWMKFTFFIYCTHNFIVKIAEKALSIIVEPTDIAVNLIFILVPTLTIAFLISVAYLIRKTKVYALLTGGR